MPYFPHYSANTGIFEMSHLFTLNPNRTQRTPNLRTLSLLGTAGCDSKDRGAAACSVGI